MGRRLTPHERLLREVAEQDFMDQLVAAARLYGWRVMHVEFAFQRSGAWGTPTIYDGPGFPDLMLVRERVVFIETKRETGKLTPKQEEWLDALRDAGQEVYVARPSDFDAMIEVLTTFKDDEEGDHP